MTHVYAPITRDSLEVIREECLQSFHTLAAERGHTLSPSEAEVCFSTLVEVLQFHHLDFLEYAVLATSSNELLEWNPVYFALKTSYERYLWRKAFGPTGIEWEAIPFSLALGGGSVDGDETSGVPAVSSLDTDHEDD